MAPSGSQHLEVVAYLTGQSNQLTARLNTTTLTATKAWVLYNSIYIPKVYYPCKISAFTRKEWSDITRAATGAFLSRMGFNQNTSCRAMFGPEQLGGVGLTHGFSQQGADGITHFLTHTQWNSDLVKVMPNVLSQL